MNASDQGPIYLGYRLGHIKNESRVFRALVYNKGPRSCTCFGDWSATTHSSGPSAAFMVSGAIGRPAPTTFVSP